jgi:hypothetical protein
MFARLYPFLLACLLAAGCSRPAAPASLSEAEARRSFMVHRAWTCPTDQDLEYLEEYHGIRLDVSRPCPCNDCADDPDNLLHIFGPAREKLQ